MAQLDGRPANVEELQALALTNYGHFTSFRVDDGRVQGLDLHLGRLVHDCRELFAADLDVDLVRHYLREAIPAQGIAMVRVTVFDPDIDFGHPDRATKPHILITQREAPTLPQSPLSVRAFAYSRTEPAIKSVDLFASLRLRRAAQLTGFDDVLFMDDEQSISEGATWNIGFFDGTDVIWPSAPHLAGVTMRLLQTVRGSRMSPVGLSDVASMKAVFATNTASGVRAITQIDQFTFPAKPEIVDQLRAKFADIPAITV